MKWSYHYPHSSLKLCIIVLQKIPLWKACINLPLSEICTKTCVFDKERVPQKNWGDGKTFIFCTTLGNPYVSTSISAMHGDSGAAEDGKSANSEHHWSIQDSTGPSKTARMDQCNFTLASTKWITWAKRMPRHAILNSLNNIYMVLSVSKQQFYPWY